MATYLFSTPTQDRVAPVLPESRGAQYLLWRHFHPTTQGLNLYGYADGSFVLDVAPQHTTAELATDVAPTVTYYGGHLYTISEDEAEALIAAGYNAYIQPMDTYFTRYEDVY